MIGFLNKLTPIARGMNIRMILTAERLTAFQGLILGAWRGENITLGPGLRKGYSRSGVRIDLVRQYARRGGRSVLPPYYVRLAEGDVSTYAVTVTEGYVGEVIRPPDDALEYHQAGNHYEAVDPPTDPVTYTDVLRKFDLTLGQAIYVDVKILASGQVGGSDPVITLVVDDDNKSSTHYIPRVDNQTSSGVAGNMRYKLATLIEGEEEGDPPVVKLYLSGSHISHIQDLPAILSTRAVDADPDIHGIGVLPKEWSNSYRAYRFRALDAELGKLHIETTDETIIVRGNKKNAELDVYYGHAVPSDPLMDFADGLHLTGNLVEGDENPPAAPETLKLFIPTVKELDADPQIRVSSTPGAGKEYLVRGNTKDGSLTYTPDGGSAVPLLTWIDGLITSENAKNIPLPAGSLPAGTDGQVLRNVSGVWTAVDVTEVTLSYCDGSGPTTGTFLKL